MYDDPGYDSPELKAVKAKVEKLSSALRGLLATFPTCTYVVLTDGQGEEFTCQEPATARLEGPHDSSWEMCVKHATQVKNEQPHPHRYHVCPREDLIQAIRDAYEAFK